MADEWPTHTLRDAGVELIDCDHRTPPASETGYPYVAIPQLRGGRIDISDARRITPENFVEWTRRAKPAAHDVVLSRRCNPGETAFVPAGLDFALGQNLVLLRADGTKVYPPFLRWLVRGSEWWDQVTKFLNVGAVFDSLKCADIPNFSLRIPPLTEQRAIAHILGTLDDKIELNRRMSETLEAMARALFKSWFVDFDPVRAKAEGRDPGLPKPLADFFPARLVDSELGEIPEGWEVKSLEEIARFLNGLALQKYRPVDGPSLPVIKIAQLRAGNAGGADRARADLDADYIVNDGDILFSWSGSLECRIWAGGPGALNQHLFKVTSDRYPPWLCYLAIHLHLDHFRHIAGGKATTMGHIQRHHLSDAKLPVPATVLLGAMDRMIEPLESAWRRTVESRTLAALRDALLPKLISGELRVKDAERLTARFG
ncbi:MAG TPA: restriction endonuclease subunit S [Myxococcales bacterium]|nr:restriction endonuclease subunit S [Myxococcales bacterium]